MPPIRRAWHLTPSCPIDVVWSSPGRHSQPDLNHIERSGRYYEESYAGDDIETYQMKRRSILCEQSMKQLYDRRIFFSIPAFKSNYENSPCC